MARLILSLDSQVLADTDADFASFRHSLKGVDQDVEKNLCQPGRIATDKEESVTIIYLGQNA